jgi:hypothetical protein
VSTKQNYINHITILLDASGSMGHLQQKVVKVTDELVAFLAKKSKEDNEETRISVYSFSDDVECHIWDMDVFRLPSIKGLYKIKGMTAMADAVHLALDDTEAVPQKYGAHDFTYYLLTDGFENASRTRDGKRPAFGRTPTEVLQEEMQKRFAGLPDNRIMLGLAPDDRSASELYKFGYAKGNVALWDATTEAGLERAVEKIKESYTSYVATRAATGVRGTRSAFTVGGQVDAAAIKAAKLKPLATGDYAIVPVTPIEGLVKEKPDPAMKKPPAGKPDNRPMVAYMEIEPFISRVHPPFRVGKAYYELVKTEKIAGNKQLAIVDKNGKVYLGAGVRQMLGLPEESRTVKPDFNPDYTIYVQSTSLNRHLYLHSSVMVLTTA